MAPTVRVGVMLPPWASATHARWNEWKARFREDGRVSISFLVGNHDLHGRNTTSAFDAVELDAYEGLDHVGKASEKSAAWWRASGNEPWRCKADDDTLVHLPRLAHALGEVDATRPSLFGFVKWRGWDFGGFRACGGVWGTAEDVWTAFDDGRCPNASGPLPYTAGAFYCMSEPARRLLRDDAEFAAFTKEARTRNVDPQRTPCYKSAACANAPAAKRMWHHEDAGVGANLFRAVVRANATLHVVATPGHFNDPFAIEMSTKPSDTFWSARSVWVHGVKRASLYSEVVHRWNISRTLDLPSLTCTDPVADRRSRWRRSRLSCADRPDAWCEIDPRPHFRMCRWAWLKPLKSQSHRPRRPTLNDH